MPAPVLVTTAARNNAEWCHLFCRSHGVNGVFEEARWFSSTRTPPLYPDVVTLRPNVTTEQALSDADETRGCSVKDSFGDLDLDAAGFAELFVAEWIVMADPPSDARSSWRAIQTDGGLAEWEAGWDDDPDGSRFFPSRLLDQPDVVFLARYDGGEITAGAIANRSADVVGLGNVFARGLDLDAAYAGASAAVAAIWPGLSVVGYEHGEPLAAAQAVGFKSTGGLRIWVR